MHVLKKILSIIIIVMMIVIPTLPFNSVFAFQGEESFFMKDISGHWGEDDLQDLAYMGIIKGENGGNANPDRFISRAEFITLLVRALNKENHPFEQKTWFTDVKTSSWYYKTVSIAREIGITNGNGDGTFLPDRNITREEIVLMLVRAIGLENSNQAVYFKDISGKYPYKSQLTAAVSSGIIKGYGDNTFRPSQKATRAEAAVMIKRMLNISSDGLNKTNEKQQIRSLLEDYISHYVTQKNDKSSDVAFHLKNSTGKENSDMKVKSEIIDLYNQKGIDITEELKNMNIEVSDVSDGLAKAKAEYDAAYTRKFDDGSQRVKTYKVEKEYYLRKINGQWKIYNTRERLYSDQKIILTWEQIAVKTPDMSGVEKMEGLDVISPTWFELREDNHPLGVGEDDPIVYNSSYDSIHMVDMGDEYFISWAHQSGYDVWGLFRNEFDINVANKVLNSKETRRKCIELLLEYTDKYKLDGINVDFENVYYNDRHALTQLVRELAPVLREQGLVTSVDVTKIEPTSWTWSMCYDRKALGEEADYIALMTYDQNGSWSKKSGSVAQFSWVERSLQGVLEQVPAEKMLLGIPFYTRVWEEINGRVTWTKPISMQEAQNLIQYNNARVIWDEQSGQYFASYQKGGKTYKIWVEDARSINLKSSLVHKYDLAGAASWRRGYETQDIWSVLNKSLKQTRTYEEWLMHNSD